MKLQEPLKLIGALVISFAAGAIGSIFTVENIPTWYAGLAKPPLLPPDWVFGPVWTVLYTMVGVALYLVWRGGNQAGKRPAYWWFGAQLVLNTAWSIVFFGLQQPWAGVSVILALIAAIVMTIREFGKESATASKLLYPYLAWVSFATYLNTGVALLN